MFDHLNCGTGHDRESVKVHTYCMFWPENVCMEKLFSEFAGLLLANRCTLIVLSPNLTSSRENLPIRSVHDAFDERMCRNADAM